MFATYAARPLFHWRRPLRFWTHRRVMRRSFLRQTLATKAWGVFTMLASRSGGSGTLIVIGCDLCPLANQGASPIGKIGIMAHVLFVIFVASSACFSPLVRAVVQAQLKSLRLD